MLLTPQNNEQRGWLLGQAIGDGAGPRWSFSRKARAGLRFGVRSFSGLLCQGSAAAGILHSITFRNSWCWMTMDRNTSSCLLLIAAYLAGAAVPLATGLQLASGYSTKFLGQWVPPNSAGFRTAMDLTAFVALVICSLLSLVVFIDGSRWQQFAACVSGTYCLITAGILAYSAVF